MRLSHNLESLNIYRNLIRTESKQSKAMFRISTGSKLNSAADDPNRIAQSERFRLELKSLQSCSKNIQDSVSLMQTMDGGIDGISKSLQRIRELTIQAGGVASDEEKSALKKEIDIMIDNVEYLASNTEFNGITLLDAGKIENNPKSIKNMVGHEGEIIEVPTYELTPDKLKINKEKFKIDNSDNIGESLGKIDEAIEVVTSARSSYGAIQNRLENSFNIVEDMSLTINGADSSISDADIAEEIMELAKNNILVEAGNAIMVQTNKLPLEILNILQNMR